MTRSHRTRPRSDLLNAPLQKETLKDAVQRRLREAILSGAMSADSRITESQIAQSLGVSRAPVREALRHLEEEGLIVSTRYRGYFVRGVDVEGLRELFLLRMALERLAVSLAVTRITDADLVALEALVGQMDQVEKARNKAAQKIIRSDLDTEFHEYICKMAHHQLLYKIWTSLKDQIQFALIAVDLAYPENATGFAASHRNLIDPLRRRDAAAAEQLIAEHIRRGMEQLVSSRDGARPLTSS